MSDTSGGGGNFIFSRGVNARLYAHALAAAYRNGIEIWDPDYSLARDPEFWEKVQRDPKIKGPMDKRLHSVAGRDWQVNPGARNPEKRDEKATDVAERILEHLDNFIEGRYNLAKGVFQGESWSYIEGEHKTLDIGGKKQKWWVPVRLRSIDKRRIRQVPVWVPGAGGNDSLQMHYELSNINSAGLWTPIRSDAPLIHFTYDNEESRMGHGRGIAEAIYFYHYAKGVVFTEGLEGLEKWARGMVVAKMDRMGTGATTNEDTAQAYLTQLERQRTGGIMVIDDKDEVEVHWPNGKGGEMVFDWLHYLDAAIAEVIMGQVIPSVGGSVIATEITRGREEGSATETLLGYDRALIYNCLTRDLLGHIWYWNQIQLREIGLGDARMPKLSPVSVDDSKPKEAIDIISAAATIGIPLIRKQVYDRIGFGMPGENDDVFEGVLAPGSQALDQNGVPINNQAMTGDATGNAKGPVKGASPPPSRPSDN